MMLIRSSKLVFAAVAAASIGCTDRQPITAPRTPSASDLIVLETPAARPAVGSVATVTALVRRPEAAAAIGSFLVALSYDTLALEYVGEQGVPGALAAANGEHAGRVLVAGASARGFVDGRLFALQFRVLQSGGLNRLTLALRELHGVDVQDRRSHAVVAPGVRVARSVRGATASP